MPARIKKTTVPILILRCNKMEKGERELTETAKNSAEMNENARDEQECTEALHGIIMMR